MHVHYAKLLVILGVHVNANIFQSRREMLTGRSMERLLAILSHRLLVKVQMDTPGSMLYTWGVVYSIDVQSYSIITGVA